ncbi:hypothetical protein STRTUCAR8_06098, partial [Streptomyces turgidiscabies Car8]
VRRAYPVPVGVHVDGAEQFQAERLGLAGGAEEIAGVDPPAAVLVLVRRSVPGDDRLAELQEGRRVGGAGVAAEGDAFDVQCSGAGGAEEEREAGEGSVGGDELVLADRGGEELVEGLVVHQDGGGSAAGVVSGRTVLVR